MLFAVKNYLILIGTYSYKVHKEIKYSHNLDLVFLTNANSYYLRDLERMRVTRKFRVPIR